MRRKDREITDRDEIISIIRKCDTCRLAIHDEPFPYIVPLNFGMEDKDGQLTLYFHSAQSGTKLDLLKKNNRVSFEMDCSHAIITYEERMSCTMGYESVIGTGTVEFIEDEEEKNRALKILLSQYHAEDYAYDTEMVRVTAVYCLKVGTMTAKRRDI